MESDLTFITNEQSRTLLDRFRVLIKDTQFFDVLVGYFYASGFHSIYPSLESTDRIRVLIGISTNRHVLNLIREAKGQGSLEFQHSSAEVREHLEEAVAAEMEASEDNASVEDGVRRFIEWIRSGKLEIKAYPSEHIHAKLYIMSFADGDRDKGRVITGSSNFTEAGLKDNLEFNVELKTRADYDFARAKFEDLWKDAVDVSDRYIESIQQRTWLNDSISPYDLYLKFLYEYFKDDLARSEELSYPYTPAEFRRLEYQEQAVHNARKILDEYGGVFISDVVGLGKTYIGALLAQELDGRTLVIAPPVLLDEGNPGSWPNVFRDFGVRQGRFQSIGKLDELIEHGTEHYKNIIIDEAHRFRTESNVTYEKLAQVCRGKRVILVTATPYNNSPKDILSQIKLFQKTKKSTIPNLSDLEKFFGGLDKRLKDLDRQRDYDEYIEVVKENSREIREKVLKYLMVRRTRSEIARYFGKDLAAQNMKFPEVAEPVPVFYELNSEEDAAFNRTVELVAKEFTFARYTPLLYLQTDIAQTERQAQLNMGRFMKILLIKRLESSFYAFKLTVDRFIASYERFLGELNKGHVWVSKKHAAKVFELLEEDDFEAIQRLIEEDKAQKHPAENFEPKLKANLERDLRLLHEIRELWSGITRDPKLSAFAHILAKDKQLAESKLIVFTESKETAEYLAESLAQDYDSQVLLYTGGASSHTRDKVIQNFDARARDKQDDYRILIATEVLSEGVNLHRSNVVINYDIPWNPTRLMQRVGRINRVDTKFEQVYSYTFFPTQQSNEQLKLKEAAQAKIHAFMTLLGEDARILTEGEPIGSHELWDRVMSKEAITGEAEDAETELKYLQFIKGIRDNQPDLFGRIKHLPRKARTGREDAKQAPALLTYFRKGKLQKFFIARSAEQSEELDFMAAAGILESVPETPRARTGEDYYPMLVANKGAFRDATLEDDGAPTTRGGRDNAAKLLRLLRVVAKDKRQLTDEQEQYLSRIMQQLEEGGFPKQTAKTALHAVEELIQGSGAQPLKVIATLQKHVSPDLLKAHVAESAARTQGPREVILSEYLTGN